MEVLAVEMFGKARIRQLAVDQPPDLPKGDQPVLPFSNDQVQRRFIEAGIGSDLETSTHVRLVGNDDDVSLLKEITTALLLDHQGKWLLVIQDADGMAQVGKAAE